MPGSGGVAEAPAFRDGFMPLPSRCLAKAFPPRLLPHFIGFIVSTLSGNLHPKDFNIYLRK
jgi:hypothetical protein